MNENKLAWKKRMKWITFDENCCCAFLLVCHVCNVLALGQPTRSNIHSQILQFQMDNGNLWKCPITEHDHTNYSIANCLVQSTVILICNIMYRVHTRKTTNHTIVDDPSIAKIKSFVRILDRNQHQFCREKIYVLITHPWWSHFHLLP